jgi:hypothetical protein
MHQLVKDVKKLLVEHINQRWKEYFLTTVASNLKVVVGSRMVTQNRRNPNDDYRLGEPVVGSQEIMGRIYIR